MTWSRSPGGAKPRWSRSRRTSRLSTNSVTNWLRRADVDEGAKPGITTVEAAEVRDLKRRNRLLEQEAEVMRRALAYFASREVSSPK